MSGEVMGQEPHAWEWELCGADALVRLPSLRPAAYEVSHCNGTIAMGLRMKWMARTVLGGTAGRVCGALVAPLDLWQGAGCCGVLR